MSNSTCMVYDDMPLVILLAKYLASVEWDCPHVIHPSWLWFWNRTAGSYLVFRDREFEISPDEAVLIPAHTLISARSIRPFEHLYCHFTVGAPFDRVACKPYRFDAEPARKFFDLFVTETPWKQRLRWRMLMLEYLLKLPENAFQSESSGSAPDQRIVRALEFCEKHYTRDFSNIEVAAHSGLSPNNFYRKFRAELGTTPKRYRINLRLDAARSLLLHSQQDISDIARTCGFADRYQFSKAFKKLYGIPPAAFRKTQSPAL